MTTNDARGAGRWVVDGLTGRPSKRTGEATPINVVARGVRNGHDGEGRDSRELEKDSGGTMSQLSGTQGSSSQQCKPCY